MRSEDSLRLSAANGGRGLEAKAPPAVERLTDALTPRIAYALVAAFVLAFGVFGVQLYREVKRELTDLVIERRGALAQLAAATLSERIDRIVDVGTSLATRVRFAELVSGGQWDAAAQILRTVPREFRFVDRIGLYDLNGALMGDIPATDGAKGQNFASRDWFQGVSRGWKPYVSEIYLRRTAPQRQVFGVAVPVVDRGGAPTGVLQLQVRLEEFFDWAHAIDVGAGGAIYVVDRKGTAAYLGTGAGAGRDASANPAVSRLLQGISGVDIAVDPADGADYLYAYVLARLGWGVVVQQPAVHAFAARDRQLLRLLAAYALIIASGAAIGGLLLSLVSQQRRLRILNLELDDLYDNASCGYHSVDADGRIVRINDTWLSWLGYKREEVVGKMTHADLMTPPSAQRFWQVEFPLFRRQGWLKDVEFEYRRKDGSTFSAALNATSILDSRGRYLMSRSTVFDITERKRAEEAIRALNTRHTKRLRILTEIDRAVVAGQPPEEIAASVIVPLRELLGVPRAIVNRFDLRAGEAEWIAASGRRRTRVGPGVRYPIGLMGDVAALRRGEPQFIDVHAQPDGEDKRALLASGVRSYVAVPMIAGDELLGAVSFGDDRAGYAQEDINIAQEVATQLAIALSQARLLEQVRSHAHELEARVRERTAMLDATNRELEAFTYSVSHDLRAPLRAVDGYARMLEEDYADRLDEEGRRLLGVVRGSSRRMGQLIDDLLNFARLGRQVPAKQMLDMTALAREVAAEIGGPVEIGALPRSEADRALLRQVWVNLIGNAVKYSSKRADARVQVDGRKETGENVYRVRDNGAGFDMRYSAKLFGVFQRLHSDEEFSGTGVGLAIAERVITRHGGRVWAEGRPGEGACFYFSLPA